MSMRGSQAFLEAVAENIARPLQALADDDFADVQARGNVGAGAMLGVVQVKGVADMVAQLLATEAEGGQRVAAAVVGSPVPLAMPGVEGVNLDLGQVFRAV
jgi:uncharacterized protein (DUF3084 family)